jgi:P2-related tail formation protein
VNEVDKLRALLPHWLEHNEEHAVDFARWAATVEEAGQREAATQIRSAIERMEQANEALRAALEALGGAIALEGHDHGH